MATEETPLLGCQPQLGKNSPQRAPSTDDVYDRFSSEQKRMILAIVSLTGLVPMFVSGCFVPSIPQIAKDLDVTPAAVSLGVSMAILASALSVVFWSAYTSFYGRRTVYICGIPVMILASFAVAASTDLNNLLLWRFVQMFGCSGGFVVGAATIGDIYKLEERGTAMGTFFGITLSGFAIAPPIGGVLAEYWSWRGFQASLGVWGVIQMLLLFFFFPETAHPGSLGINKAQDGKKPFVWVNPFRCLALLRSPNIMAVTLATTFVLVTDYVMLVPIAYTVGAKYGITSEGIIGTLLLPTGCGNFLGAPISGHLSDAVIRRAKQGRNGVWIPEDRLRGVWIGTLVLVPLSVILAGLATTYVDGVLGLVFNLMCLFANGLGVDMVLSPVGAYTVDIMPSRSAEVMAAIWAFRSLLITPIPALCIPAIETIGMLATNSISGIAALVGYFLIWLTIRYGKQMRAYVDIGYPDFCAERLNVA